MNIFHFILYSVLTCTSAFSFAKRHAPSKQQEKQLQKTELKNQVHEKISHANSDIKHVAIIMDGNRRWAQQNNLEPGEGHRQGVKNTISLCKCAIRNGIKMLSTFALSVENLKRNEKELTNIFTIIIEQSKKLLPDFITEGVRVQFIGNRNVFPATVASAITMLETLTQDGDQLQLNIFFCYGGRQEILLAVERTLQAKQEGKNNHSVEKEFTSHLWSASLPDPDLIIRTGGMKRLSNFLTYQSAYSELYFTDILWPDFSDKDLDDALANYAQRKRNFGT